MKIFEVNGMARVGSMWIKAFPFKVIFRTCCYVITPEMSKKVFADN